MKVLVTGASGFLGGRVARLLAEKHEVTGTGRTFAPERRAELEGLGVRLVRADLTADLHPPLGKLPSRADRLRGSASRWRRSEQPHPGDPHSLQRGAAIEALLENIDAVVHCAALSTLWGRWENLQRTNVEASAWLAAACAERGIRLVHVSSPSIYNRAVKDDPSWGTPERPVPETLPVGPRFDSDYAKSKWLAEVEVARAHPAACILRPRGIYGPGDTSIMPRVIAALRAGRLPRLVDEDVLTDLTHVDNAAHAARLAVESEVSGPINIADGTPIAIWAGIDQVADALGVARPHRRLPARAVELAAAGTEQVARLLRRGEPKLTATGIRLLTRGLRLDLTRARDELGYTPVNTEGLASALPAVSTCSFPGVEQPPATEEAVASSKQPATAFRQAQGAEGGAQGAEGGAQGAEGGAQGAEGGAQDTEAEPQGAGGVLRALSRPQRRSRQGPSSKRPAGPAVELEHLHAGWCVSVGALAQRGESWRRQRFPAGVTLIRHPEHGLFLFDTGYSRAAVEAVRHWPAWLYGKLLPVHLPPGQALVEQLTERNETAEVRGIICSHLHMDHIAGANDFPHAPVWLDQAEIVAITGHTGFGAVRHGIVPAIVPEEHRLRPFTYTDAPPELAPFTRAMDFFGDGSLWIVPSPGHTVGSVGAVAHTDADHSDGADLVLLAGDIAWSERALREGIEPHWLTRRLVAHDLAATRQTATLWREWLTRYPAAQVVVSHEPSA